MPTSEQTTTAFRSDMINAEKRVQVAEQTVNEIKEQLKAAKDSYEAAVERMRELVRDEMEENIFNSEQAD